MPPSSRQIAVLIETSSAFARGLIRGISAFARDHPHWSVRLREGVLDAQSLAWIRDWKGQGIIGRFDHEAVWRQALRSDLAMVSVGGGNWTPHGVPWVDTDNTQVAELAARDLIDRGHTRFGYCGFTDLPWSAHRRDAFVTSLAREDLTCATLDIPAHATRAAEKARRSLITQWLQTLPRPMAVLACNDACGQILIESAIAAGLSIPDDLAVLGVDNDEMICELCQPTLSSIIPNGPRIGFEAAEMLEQRMNDSSHQPEPRLVPPIGIETRRSTDAGAIDDQSIAEAMRYIQHHACVGIQVEDVVQAVHLSRSHLENRFRELVGRSPHDEIMRVRLMQAERMIRANELPLKTIAQRCGFKTPEYMSRVFRRERGVNPSALRNSASSS